MKILNKIKKHFNKILIACLTLISSIAIFSSINKTYAYTTNQWSYTLNENDVTLGNNILQYNATDNYVYNTSPIDSTNRNTSNIKFGYLDSNYYQQVYNSDYILINFYIEVSQDGITYTEYSGSTFTLYILGANNYSSNNTIMSNSIRLNPYYKNDGYYTTILNGSNKSANNTLYTPYISFYGLSNLVSYFRFYIYNIDVVKKQDIGIQQYYDTYYGQIEDNYNQLLSDYNDLQDNYDTLNDEYLELNEQYDDLNNDLQDLQGQYDDLQVDYTNLQNEYNTIDESLSHNIINELVGNNYFTKSNIQLLQNENYFAHNDHQTNPFGATTPIYAMLSNYIDNKTLYIGSALEWVSNNNFYNNQYYDSSYFTWLNIAPFYNYSSNMVTENGVSRWDSNSSIHPLCKYVNMTIISSRDIIVEVVLQDAYNSSIYETIERDETTGNYEIKFDNNDERVFVTLHLQCKLSNGVYYTADRIISNTGNITDNQYELGFQNGSVSSQATINSLNNDIRNLNEEITRANLTIQSLNEQINSISSNYNLNNLIWTIGGTPFESFKQIWNVNFFGVNITEILTGFLTALIALYIIKKFFK